MGTTTSAPGVAGATTSSPALVACEAGDLDPVELEPLMVLDIGGGYAREPDDVGDTGPSRLAKAITDDGEPDAERVLNGTGFRRGYQRLFTNDAGAALVLFVYEFCSNDGARSYARRARTVLGATDQPVEDMPVAGDAEGFNIETEDLRGVWLWRTTGPFLVQVISHVDMPTRLGDQLDRALLLLDTQAERLAPRLDATQP